jgi:hypothetical protein
MVAKIVKRSLIALGVLFVLIQLYRPERTNPSVSSEGGMEADVRVPHEVATLLRRSCADCHSYETRWPWYSNVAPVSWIVAHDVHEGREHLNLSEWARYGNEDKALRLGEICKELRSGAMPMPRYLRLHPEAKVSPDEIETICAWSKEEGRRLVSEIGSQ